MEFKAIIQARTTSSRLPNKVLKKILNKTMLEHIIYRVSKSKYIKDIIIATTTNKEDELIVKFAENNGILCYRGSENNVLERYYECAKLYNVDNIVRITSDDPFKDPIIIDEVIELFTNNKLDYANNFTIPSYPEGLDVEVFSFNTLRYVYENADKDYEKEHVTPYIWMNHPKKFKIDILKSKIDYSDIRLTVDTKEDFVFATKIYERLYKEDDIFHLYDIIELLKKDKLLQKYMPNIRRNDGLLKSMGDVCE
jgi:spore coat polysaccharide biosynthesis protein SpsF